MKFTLIFSTSEDAFKSFSRWEFEDGCEATLRKTSSLVTPTKRYILRGDFLKVFQDGSLRLVAQQHSEKRSF